MIVIRQSRPEDGEALLGIWCRAVDASHHFLKPEDRSAIEPLVAQYVRTVPLQVAAIDGRLVAFMGITGQKIDSLFVDPQAQGAGIGRQLTDRVPRLTEVDVNEQNGAALAFYRRLGFQIAGRSELDDQGLPYPLLHLRRD